MPGKLVTTYLTFFPFYFIYQSLSRSVTDLQGSVEDLSSRCQELINLSPTRKREELGEQLNDLKAKCENLEGKRA